MGHGKGPKVTEEEWKREYPMTREGAFAPFPLGYVWPASWMVELARELPWSAWTVQRMASELMDIFGATQEQAEIVIRTSCQTGGSPLVLLRILYAELDGEDPGHIPIRRIGFGKERTPLRARLRWWWLRLTRRATKTSRYLR